MRKDGVLIGWLLFLFTLVVLNALEVENKWTPSHNARTTWQKVTAHDALKDRALAG